MPFRPLKWLSAARTSGKDGAGKVFAIGANKIVPDLPTGLRRVHEYCFPLVDAGFTKAMVRDLSRHLGLRTADKPAAACLASRVPYGTPVTVGVLAEVEAAEAALHALGFAELRVRHYRDLARLEVPVDRLADVVERRSEVVDAVRSAGYRYVTLDLEGLRRALSFARLAARVAEVLDRDPGCCGYLIAGHGFYTWGATVADAVRHQLLGRERRRLHERCFDTLREHLPDEVVINHLDEQALLQPQPVGQGPVEAAVDGPLGQRQVAAVGDELVCGREGVDQPCLGHQVQLGLRQGLPAAVEAHLEAAVGPGRMAVPAQHQGFQVVPVPAGVDAVAVAAVGVGAGGKAGEQGEGAPAGQAAHVSAHAARWPSSSRPCWPCRGRPTPCRRPG